MTPVRFGVPALSANVHFVGRRRFLQLFGAGAVVVAFHHLATAAQTAEGTVTGVSDGDTCHAIVAGQKVRVRLAEIDAPEKGQAYGRRSEESLRDLVGGKAVRLVWSDVDRYGRLIAHMSNAAGVDVSAAQVQRGYAWVYRKYSSNPLLLRHEAAARSARLGLWADDHPLEPWVWRLRSKKDQPLG